MTTAILLMLTMAAPPPPKGPPAPKNPVNRAQPQGHKPYMHARPIEGRRAMDYHREHGVRFRHGVYYRGYMHPHWSHHVWSRAHGCFVYFDPGERCWYYWNRQYYCYFPVTYLPEGSRYDGDYEAEPKKPDKIPNIPPPEKE